jgi:hypothetical protein
MPEPDGIIEFKAHLQKLCSKHVLFHPEPAVQQIMIQLIAIDVFEYAFGLVHDASLR